jgi:Z1 domain-containing protein
VTDETQNAIRTVRALLDLGHPLDRVLELPIIPPGLRDVIRADIERDRNVTLSPARTLVRDQDRADWISKLDRSTWYYWPELRQYLLRSGRMDNSAVRSLDDSSDRVLRQLEPPTEERYDVRGLVLGFVQSGKTANFTALAAKAADAGYRLIIVLSGIDNGLRQQTNQRLKRELVGYNDGRTEAVHFPPVGRQWYEFTRPETDGDFRAGFANAAALQGDQPVLLVIKKNGAVLRRLLGWLQQASPDALRQLPVLVIDDEADLASIDTRGSRPTTVPPGSAAAEQPDPPSVINGLIRQLLNAFRRRAYVAYTATPFANILIPHDVEDPKVGNDLYPRDFIVDLPKPAGYFGAEEIFGVRDSNSGAPRGGLDVLRATVSDEDLAAIDRGELPASLDSALLDFVLAGAARAQRGQGSKPGTMLVHTSPRIIEQASLRAKVETRFSELRDEWRYQRKAGIRERLNGRWEATFRPVSRQVHPELDVPFDRIEEHVGPFFEAVEVREINSFTGAVLDYEKEPALKAIAIGGNRLSRGLTLDGLTTSYFVRESATYDTLMQMGRWFGFRSGYDDLTRIWTTAELAGWFSDLAFAERRLREDIQVYESIGLTPLQVGMRIWQHPTMQVTAPLKRRFAANTVIQQDYSFSLEQTFKFPLRKPGDLADQTRANLKAVREFVPTLGSFSSRDGRGPVWTNVTAQQVLTFLGAYQVDEEVRNISLPLIVKYIERCLLAGELVRWIVAVRGRGTVEPRLGQTDWGLPGGEVGQISRSRILDGNSLGVITDNTAGDEAAGFPPDQLKTLEEHLAAAQASDKPLSRNQCARQLRAPEEGLLLLYPISKRSNPREDAPGGGTRRPLFDNPDDPNAVDLVAIALSFPKSRQPQNVEAYLVGTVGWKPVE